MDKRFVLPEIIAVSEKQKKYAESLRKKYLDYYRAELERTNNLINKLDQISEEKLNAAIEKYGTKEKAIRASFEMRELLPYYIMLTSSDAGEIIEALR